jgi:hypothetical protein
MDDGSEKESRQLADLKDDLDATADDVEAAAKRLQAIEAEKETLSLDDPRLAQLSAEAKELGDRLGVTTKAEEQLEQEAASAS